MRLSRGSGVRAFDLSGSVAIPSAPFSALLRLFGSGIYGLAVSGGRRAGVDIPPAIGNRRRWPNGWVSYTFRLQAYQRGPARPVGGPVTTWSTFKNPGR